MWAYYGIGLLSLCQGDLRRALPRLERAMDTCQEANLPIFFPRMAAALGAAYLLSGCLEEAYTLVEQALGHARAHQERGTEAYALRLPGSMKTRGGIGWLQG